MQAGSYNFNGFNVTISKVDDGFDLVITRMGTVVQSSTDFKTYEAARRTADRFIENSPIKPLN